MALSRDHLAPWMPFATTDYTVDAAARFLTGTDICWQTGIEYRYAITVAGAIAGSCGLVPSRREPTVEIGYRAIGIAGIRYLEEPAAEQDLFGNPAAPQINRVDELAAAASALMGQTSRATPVVVIRGADFTTDDNAAIAPLILRSHPAFSREYPPINPVDRLPS